MSILQMSISASVLVLVIVVIRALGLNKLPKSMFLALWGVVLYRLLIPFNIPSSFSIYSIIGNMAAHLTPQVLAARGISPVTLVDTDFSTETLLLQEVQGQTLSFTATTIVWLIGLVSMLLFFLVAYYKNNKELKMALPIGDNALIDGWLAENKLIRTLQVLQSDMISTPIAVGIMKPRIILPKAMDTTSQQFMQHVLTHEFQHLKHFDMLWKMVLILALCVHWFNPLIWLMFVLANRDLELACDEKVIRHFGANVKSEYALSLIGMAESRSKFAPLYNAFSKNAAEERIMSIMKYKKASIITIALSVLLIIGTTTVFAFGDSASSTQTNSIAGSGAGQITENVTQEFTEYEKYGLTYDKAEFEARNIDELKNPKTVIAYSGEQLTPNELAKEYLIYEPFGVTYDKVQDRFFYKGQSVRDFADIMSTNGESFSNGKFSGSIRTIKKTDGEVDVYTVRDFDSLDSDGYGKLIGIEVGSRAD